MKLNLIQVRTLHRILVPILCLPLLLTLTTGVMFQIMAMDGKGDRYLWLLEAHRGKFGHINLEWIYPFINAFGLFTLIVTGVIMWLTFSPRKRPIR